MPRRVVVRPARGCAGKRGALRGRADPGGLGPEGLTGAGQVNLDSHVDQVASALASAAETAGEPVVLVGHSYGGRVITGVADRAPGQVRALVYLDAFVPDDGDSYWSMTNDEQRAWYIRGAGRDGLAVDPLPFFDQRARPQPLATRLQRAHLVGAWSQVPAKTYVAAIGWPGGLAASPFAPTAAAHRRRSRLDPPRMADSAQRLARRPPTPPRASPIVLTRLGQDGPTGRSAPCFPAVFAAEHHHLDRTGHPAPLQHGPYVEAGVDDDATSKPSRAQADSQRALHDVREPPGTSRKATRDRTRSTALHVVTQCRSLRCWRRGSFASRSATSS